MHELSLMHALFDAADAALGVHPRAAVRELRVRIGALAGVEPELFQAAFSDCREERGYAQAALKVVTEAARWACRVCAAPVAEGGPLVCPRCGEDGEVALVMGDALVLERIELEVPDV